MNKRDELKSRRFWAPVNRLLAWIQVTDIMGKHRLYLWLSKHHSNKVISHNLSKREFVVPVDEWCFWLEKGPQHYYLDEFVPFFTMINHNNQPFSFFDLGADIGTVSALIHQYCPAVQTIFAFEPNPHSFQLLSHNLAQLDKTSHGANAAVSNVDGYVAFNASSDSTIDHEGTIDPTSPGNTRVYSLDNWLQTNADIQVLPYVVLKIDVEGQELQVIQGASKLIQQAEQLLVLIEIHPEVLKKTATTAEQLFEEFEKIRDFNWFVPKHHNQQIDRSRDFFSQFPHQQFDVIGCSGLITQA